MMCDGSDGQPRDAQPQVVQLVARHENHSSKNPSQLGSFEPGSRVALGYMPAHIRRGPSGLS